MSRVILLATGGTIASQSTVAGRGVAVSAADLLSTVQRLYNLDDIELAAEDVMQIVSFAATVPQILQLADILRDRSKDADGIVITHGTATLEETAFLLSLCRNINVPVTLTGAQRPFDDPAPDGMRNLSAAIRWVASPASQGTGVTVTFADQVFSAVGVRKTSSFALAAFSSPGRGPIGYVDEAGVRRQSNILCAPPLISPGTTELPRVDIITQYLGSDDWAVNAAIAAGDPGIVIAGFGPGDTTPDVTKACQQYLEQGGQVIVASRTGSGPVKGMYSGGLLELVKQGAISSGDLSAWQARLLLASALELAEKEGTNSVPQICETWLNEAGVVAASTVA